MDPDFLLIQKIKNEDEEAISCFIRKYYPKIFQYCLLHIFDHGHAEDLTQETFMKFLQSIDSYRHYGKAINYLYVIAGNACKDFYKKKKELRYDDLSEREMLSATDSSIAAGLKVDVENALKKLPDELKEIVILFYFQGLKQREIARLEKISLSLVKYRMERAKNYWKNI